MKRTVAKLIIGMAITAIGMFAADSSIGAWKWNAAKSKSISTNPLKSRIDAYEATSDGGVKVTRKEVRADGTTFDSTFTFKYDGKEYPVKGLQYDTISAKRIDESTTVTEVKKTGGQLHQTTRTVYSKDGKTKTSSIKGTDTAGKPVDSTYVYDRQ